MTSRRSRHLGLASIGGVALALTSAPAARADLPGASIVKDVIGGATGWTFDTIASGITGWVLGAVSYFVNGAVDFLRTSARPDVEAVWFAGPGSPYAAVRGIAVVLLVGFVLLGVLHGLVHGDPAGMLRRVAGKLPVAVVGMVATTVVVGRLLALTDALSDAVLSGTGGQAVHFLSGFGIAAAGVTSGFAAVVLGLVAVLAALVLWVELIVRASLVYLLVAISPIGFAATLWPAARGFLHKTVEVLIAVIASKFVICVALSIGVAALAGAAGGPAGSADAAATAGMGPSVGVGLSTLLVGAVILGLAAFSPFLVLRLIPLAEGAVVAQGISRAPARAVQAGAATYSSTRTLSRLGGTGGFEAGGSSVGGGHAGPAGPAPSGSAGSAATRSAATGPGSGGLAGGADAPGVPFDASRRKAASQTNAAGTNGARHNGGWSPPEEPDSNGRGQR